MPANSENSKTLTAPNSNHSNNRLTSATSTSNNYGNYTEAFHQPSQTQYSLMYNAFLAYYTAHLQARHSAIPMLPYVATMTPTLNTHQHSTNLQQAIPQPMIAVEESNSSTNNSSSTNTCQPSTTNAITTAMNTTDSQPSPQLPVMTLIQLASYITTPAQIVINMQAHLGLFGAIPGKPCIYQLESSLTYQKNQCPRFFKLLERANLELSVRPHNNQWGLALLSTAKDPDPTVMLATFQALILRKQWDDTIQRRERFCRRKASTAVPKYPNFFTGSPVNNLYWDSSSINKNAVPAIVLTLDTNTSHTIPIAQNNAPSLVASNVSNCPSISATESAVPAQTVGLFANTETGPQNNGANQNLSSCNL